MSTSLAAQLKKLQVPQTSLFHQDKLRQSLLFDPREAATLDRDTVHAIGLTGLEELVIVDPSFAQFHSTLFSESSKQIERSVLTAEVNQQLNKSISCFLRLLSPYFLLRASHKALEWLIHRFHIHLYNIDDLVSCVLPFHESRIFVRVVQLLDLRDPAGRWHWLLPLQKPGLPLPKSTLVTHCYKDLSFMKLVCDLVPNYLKAKRTSSANQALVGFYVVTVLGALEYAKKITEEMLSCLLPYLLQGLKSPCSNYCAATYMILSQITSRATLSPTILDKLLIKMAQYVKGDFTKEYCICTLVIFQHQSIASVPAGVLSLLKNNVMLQEELEKASEQFQTKGLVKPLLITLIHDLLSCQEDERETTTQFITRIVSGIPMDEHTIGKIVRVLLKTYLKQFPSAKASKGTNQFELLRKSCLLVLGLIERKYPEICDCAVESFLGSLKSQKATRLQNLLRSSSHLPEHCLLEGSTTPLFLALNHPSQERRVSAVQTLISSLNKGKLSSGSRFLRDSLLTRLDDDNPKVVQAVLSLGEKLFEICPKDKVLQKLLKILQRIQSTEWSSVHRSLVTLLCSESAVLESSYVDRITAAMLVYLFPTFSLETARLILQSYLALTQPLLHRLATEHGKHLAMLIDNADGLQKWTERIHRALRTLSSGINTSSLSPLMEILSSEDEKLVMPHYLALLMLQHSLSSESDATQFFKLSRMMLKIVNKVLPLITPSSCLPETFLVSVRKGRLPASAVSPILMTLIQCLPKSNTDVAYLRMEIFEFLSSSGETVLAEDFAVLLEAFLEQHFESSFDALVFLSSRWADHFREEEMEMKFQLASLLSAHRMLSSSASDAFENLLNGQFLELVNLLLSLMCPNAKVRSAGLQCLKLISNSSVKSPKPHLALVAHVTRHSEEILTDEK